MAETAQDEIAQAEAQRRAGRAQDAEHRARALLARHPDEATGYLVLGLALIDQGRGEDAYAALERAASGLVGELGGLAGPRAAAFGDVSEGELERAFADAEPDREQVVDADRIAREAMEEVELDLPEELAPGSSPFATRTVAELLERQGDPRGAERIRGALEASAQAPEDRRQRKIRRLERWLVQLRRGIR